MQKLVSPSTSLIFSPTKAGMERSAMTDSTELSVIARCSIPAFVGENIKLVDGLINVYSRLSEGSHFVAG